MLVRLEKLIIEQGLLIQSVMFGGVTDDNFVVSSNIGGGDDEFCE
jgi:hypothetical protein